MAAVFDALGSATRRKILDLVKENPGCSVGEVAAEFDTTRVAVMHQLRQLEECDLILSRKDGRSRRLYHNPVPIQLIYDRWTDEYGGFWASKLADVKYAVEAKAAGKTNEGASPKGEKNERNGDPRIEDSDQGGDRGRVA